MEAGGDAPDTLMEYCFFAALKLTCTDSELPITATSFTTTCNQLGQRASLS